MQASMEGIESKLIFPHNPVIEKKIPDLPNKYIAIFNDADEAEAAAKKSEENIKRFWRDICTDVWKKVLEDPARFSPVTRTLWNEQTDPAHVFEIFWVIVTGDVEHYKKWLTETQFALDRRKHLRNFQQQEESGEKSTISGLRSALRGPGEWRSDVQTFWYHVAKEQSSRDISTDGTERLDAIDTVKRFAYSSKSLAQRLNRTKIDAGYPSTSSIATATYVERLIAESKNPLLSSAISEWLQEANKLGEMMPATIPLLSAQAKQYTLGAKILECDGDCLFPETFSVGRLKKEFRFGDERKDEREKLAQSGPKALSALLRITDTITPPITRPTPYYAMIQMDGDKMGKLINGVQSKDEHENISWALSAFSRRYASAIVEDTYPGRLIYAGGDDVFALAPLARDSLPVIPTREDNVCPSKTVLDLVYQLQQRYREVVQEKVIDVVQTTEAASEKSRKSQVAASTGIAIAHHYTSLSYVRRISKEAEQLAKNHYGRNALVVTVLRRSGEQTRVGCHWQYPKLIKEAQPIPLFLSFYDLFKEDVLSPKCVFNLLEEVSTLVGLSREAQESEVKRVLRRQRNPALEKRLQDDEIRHKAKYLIKLAKAIDKEEYPILDEKLGLSVELHSDHRRYGLVEVLGWLLVMLFLARKEQG
jgi:CRISPR-associated protein Cmr2